MLYLFLEQDEVFKGELKWMRMNNGKEIVV